MIRESLTILRASKAFSHNTPAFRSSKSFFHPWRLSIFVAIAWCGIAILCRDYLGNRPDTMYWFLAVVWTTDIASFYFGSSIGGPKLCPSVSPNKTWSGLVGGIVSAWVVGYFLQDHYISFQNHSNRAIQLTIVIPFLCQMGELLESYMKRLVGVKDSGNVIPGHGGVWDRLDSMVVSLPVFYLMIQ